MAKKVVIALGGNAILQSNQEATFENQLANIQKSCEVIAKIIKKGYKVIITHGNGPQVGNILRQNEEMKEVIPPLPLDVCSGQSQGFIGYMIEQALKNELKKGNIQRNVVSILTQTVVSEDDPAFKEPDKPIGIFYTEEEAKKYAAEKGWAVKEDSGRGWRRVVPSPAPQEIVEAETIKRLVESDTIVIACGGGGIPVIVKEDGTYQGVEAVIDKDRCGYQLAVETDADIFMILTDVENVFINYGTPYEEALGKVSVETAKGYLEDGQFSVGSMGPKVEAAIKFADLGKRSIICSLDQAHLAIDGKVGTQIS